MRAQRSVAVLVLLAGMGLASCGSTDSPSATLYAGPSLNISVPLSLGDCDGAGVCYALGTTDAESTPTDAAQMVSRHGVWQSIPVPAAPDAELTTMSCWYGGCLVFGVADAGTFAWRVHISSVAATSVPAGVVAVVSLSCFASATCGLVATTTTGKTDFWLTQNGGESWNAPTAMTTSPGDHVLALSCSGPHVCVATGTSAAGAFTISTVDGGERWSRPTVSSSWRSLTDTFCSPASCVALADADGTYTEVTGGADGALWTAAQRQPGGSTNVLACGSVTDCIATTESVTENPGLSMGTAKKWTPLSSEYLPTGIASLGCSLARCVVVDNAALATLSP